MIATSSSYPVPLALDRDSLRGPAGHDISDDHHAIREYGFVPCRDERCCIEALHETHEVTGTGRGRPPKRCRGCGSAKTKVDHRCVDCGAIAR